ncbi:MAG: 4-phosphoerythronate dehydrogenase [Zetaproteobacteria bacterium]|nr:4-phosphoerythronate dehydrogenase [Zetaproteobacteria bacterium]
MRALKIIADQSIWNISDALKTLAQTIPLDVTVFPPYEINAEVVRKADVLLVRSSVKVNASLLEGSTLRFVGTATIGDDHIDLDYLSRNHIAFASAAGSSTESVVEYILASLLELHVHDHIDLSKVNIGVIGVGRIGSMLSSQLKKISVHVLHNDPPRQRYENHLAEDSSWQTLPQILQHADLLTLHTPLTYGGFDATHHLINAATLDAFKGRGIINAGRGGIIDNQALLAWLNHDVSRFVILDCWENEPAISAELLASTQVVLATPHIAGHSVDGKAANTAYVFKALAHFLQQGVQWEYHHLMPKSQRLLVHDHLTYPTVWHRLHAYVEQAYPIVDDHLNFRASLMGAGPESIKNTFNQLRKAYPERRSWSCHTFAPSQNGSPIDKICNNHLTSLGFIPQS